MFFEVRLPWFILFFTSLSAAVKQYETYGYVTPQVMFVLYAHWLYANACSKGEELIITTWDMFFEKFGFMLIFWNMAGVPFTYAHCTLFLINHKPEDYEWSTAYNVFLFVTITVSYYFFDIANSQKNRFRQQRLGTMIKRNTFPSCPGKPSRTLLSSSARTVLLFSPPVSTAGAESLTTPLISSCASPGLSCAVLLLPCLTSTRSSSSWCSSTELTETLSDWSESTVRTTRSSSDRSLGSSSLMFSKR